ncbi:MAG: response regulator transcription factor [Gammaproteobacteria bacterium]|nr:response regulator transcription factor [Gammaproteobacteria bacterium]
MSDKPVLLWIDATLAGNTANAELEFGSHFEIRLATESAAELNDPDRAPPHILCFDFDFPDRAGLNLLKQTKAAHPSIPIIMLTVQHSEKLAVWAFRAGVWDYFVKPVSALDIERCCKSLRHVIEAVSNRFTRESVRSTPPIPLETRFPVTNTGEKLLAPAIAYVGMHFGEKISQTEVAQTCGMGQFRFSRVFSQVMGMTFQEYLIRYRIREARRLLATPHAAVGDVAAVVGFNDTSYFSRVFKKYCGCSPSQYREADHREPLSNDGDQLEVVLEELELA